MPLQWAVLKYPVPGTWGTLPERWSASFGARVSERRSPPRREPSGRASVRTVGVAIPSGPPGASDWYRVHGTSVVLGTHRCSSQDPLISEWSLTVSSPFSPSITTSSPISELCSVERRIVHFEPTIVSVSVDPSTLLPFPNVTLGPIVAFESITSSST